MDILTQSIGVDAAKSELVISVEAQKPFSVSNDMESLEAAKSRFPKGATVYIESSGGYERTAIRFFRDQGFKIALLNPLKARRLAQAQGVSAKTDPIDARMLARSGHLVKASAPKSQERQGLSDLSRAIEAIKDEVAELRRRLQVPELDLRAAELYRSCLEVLQAKVKEGEAKFRRDVKGTTLEHAYQLCQSIPGVGEKTARVLVCELPEDLAERSAAQIASYAGVAPLDDSSGTRVRAKLSRGNHRLKKTLFMPALVCMRTQAWGKDLYARLRAKGKSHQTCMVAIMRRLLIRIVSVLKRGSPWSCEPLAT